MTKPVSHFLIIILICAAVSDILSFWCKHILFIIMCVCVIQRKVTNNSVISVKFGTQELTSNIIYQTEVMLLCWNVLLFNYCYCCFKYISFIYKVKDHTNVICVRNGSLMHQTKPGIRKRTVVIMSTLTHIENQREMEIYLI